MQTGLFDKTRLLANTLMVLLVALNIFFSIQYTQNIKKQDEATIAESNKIEQRLQTAQFMKFFIDKVLGTNGTISFEDRVNKLRLNTDRADVIVPAASIYLTAMELGGCKTILVPDLGLKDGIIQMLYDRYLNRKK
jgi:exopolyphosphatase/pppGpp-phosphohydrolase